MTNPTKKGKAMDKKNPNAKTIKQLAIEYAKQEGLHRDKVAIKGFEEQLRALVIRQRLVGSDAATSLDDPFIEGPSQSVQEAIQRLREHKEPDKEWEDAYSKLLRLYDEEVIALELLRHPKRYKDVTRLQAYAKPTYTKEQLRRKTLKHEPVEVLEQMAERFLLSDGVITKVREQNKAMVRRVLNLLTSDFYAQGEYVTHGPIYDALTEIDSDAVHQLESIAQLDESKQKQMLFVVFVRELQPLKSVEDYERFIRTLVKLVEQYGKA